ncbi:MAG: hypothetical protein KatS3mg027_0462 [Bacteroidia bacterium]|nr:MAG: hypothetical protein KatS3mg027_0462 [Bacteroidia bacterium]
MCFIIVVSYELFVIARELRSRSNLKCYFHFSLTRLLRTTSSWLVMTNPTSRHCEERSDEAISNDVPFSLAELLPLPLLSLFLKRCGRVAMTDHIKLSCIFQCAQILELIFCLSSNTFKISH